MKGNNTLLRTICVIVVLIAGWVMALTLGLISLGRDTTRNSTNIIHIQNSLDEIKDRQIVIVEKIDNLRGCGEE